jgi:hypothetical protein
MNSLVNAQKGANVLTDSCRSARASTGMPRKAPYRASRRLLAITAILITTTVGAWTAAVAAVGFHDFSFANSDGLTTPTGSKPESKAWFNDNGWWAVMFNLTLHGTDIYKLDPATQRWTDTGTPVDDRPTAKADALWNQTSGKLYIVSNLHVNSAASTTASSNWGRLYRYSYDSGTKVYSLDSGFPVTVTKGKEETLVVAKDSTGTLWVAYVEGSKVMVNHSNGSDLVWGNPFALPVSTAARSTTSDDIASIIAFGGDKIGVFWSNQRTANDYFAIHQDGAPDTTWLPEEIALGSGVNCSGACADDHINIKSDSTGKLYVASKTSFSSDSQPLINLLVRATNGTWSRTTYSTHAFGDTRGIVLLDEAHDRLYFFVTSTEAGGDIDYKITSMSSPSFIDGDGDPFIDNPTDAHINNATSSKQNVTSSTGLMVMACDDTSKFYVHNFIVPSAGNVPTIVSFTPTSGPASTSVVITGTGFTGAVSVKFNGTNASFTVNSSTQITAIVPSSASSGLIAVTTPSGTGTSSASFTVTATAPPPPVVSSFSPTQGAVGTSVTISGSNFTGANSVTFNTMSTASLTVNSDSSITVSVPTGASTGPVSVTTPLGGTGTSSTSFTVTGSTRIKDITFENGSITEPTTGFDSKTGTVTLETASPIKGANSMTVMVGSSYGQENYSATDELFISFYLKIAALPSGQVRLARIADQGTTVGALTLEATGKLTLRNFVTSLGTNAAALNPGTVYRIAIHQKKGTGSNAVLEGFLATGDASFATPFASSGTQTFTTRADSVQIGASTSTGATLTFDDIRLDTQAMPEPSVP